MLTSKQTDAVSAALLRQAARERKPVLNCPSCDGMSLSQKAREKLFPVMRIHWPKCRVALRMRWGRSLLFGSIAALLLIAAAGLVGIPGFHKLPAALAVILDGCVIATFHAIKRRLSLEARR